MLKVMVPVLVQLADPLQLLLALWLNENVVVLVLLSCAYAIGAITAIVAAAIAPTARIVAKIGSILFIIAVPYKLLIKDIV
jgi:hypothetical protein